MKETRNSLFQKEENKKIIVALSGGADSFVAAGLLKKEGYEVIGLHLRLVGDGNEDRSEHKAIERVFKIAKILDIDLEVIDLRKEFKEQIISYFVNSYIKGLTPNPCILCNKIIKFKKLLSMARSLNAAGIATGHYVRVVYDEKEARFCLLKGIDSEKDQSYFLFMLDQEMLGMALFPLGDKKKEEARKIASQWDSAFSATKESHEVCFISKKDYRDFIFSQLGKQLPGEIVNMKGEMRGRHSGIFRYTVGQRRGLNLKDRPDGPYYVVRLDPSSNRVVVGKREDLMARGLRADSINWVSSRPSDAPFRATIKFRYRGEEVPGHVVPVNADTADFIFDKPAGPIAPGQAAVAYIDDKLILGGWIKEAIKD